MENEKGFNQVLESVILGQGGHAVPAPKVKVEEKKEEQKQEQPKKDEEKKEVQEPKKEITKEEEKIEKEKEVEEQEKDEGQEQEGQEEQEQEVDEDESLYEMDTEDLLVEYAKESGYISDEDLKDIKNPAEIIDLVANKSKIGSEKQYEEVYGKDNFRLFKQFLEGKLNTQEGQSYAKDIQLLDILNKVPIEGEGENIQKNRIHLLMHRYMKEKNLPQEEARVIVSNIIETGKDLEMAKKIQSELVESKKKRQQEFEEEQSRTEKENINELNKIIESSKLEDLFLKTEKERERLKKAINNKTEEMIYTDKFGVKRKEMLTKAQKLMQDALFNDKKKFLTIVSLLENINSRKDVDKQIENSRKNKILDAMLKSRKENKEKINKTKDSKGKSYFEKLRDENKKFIN